MLWPLCTWGMTTYTSRWPGGSSQSPAPTAGCQTWCCKSASVSQCTSGPRTWEGYDIWHVVFSSIWTNLSTWPVLPQPHGLEYQESFQACSDIINDCINRQKEKELFECQTCCWSRCLGPGWRIPALWSTGSGLRPSPFVPGRPSSVSLMSCEPQIIHNNHMVTRRDRLRYTYLGQEVLAPPAALVVLLDLGPALDDGVVLGQELLPLVLPQLGRGNVQVNMVPAPEKLVASVKGFFAFYPDQVAYSINLAMLKSINVLRTRPDLASIAWVPCSMWVETNHFSTFMHAVSL